MDGPIRVHGATASVSALTTPTARALNQDDEARRSDTMGVSKTITTEEPRRFAPLPKRQRLQRVQPSRDEDGDHTLSTSTARSAPPRTMTMTTTGKTRAASVPSSKSASTLIKPQDLEVEDEQWDEHVETNRMMEQSSLTTRNQEAHQALLEYRSNDHEHGEDDQGRTSNHPTPSRRPPLVSSLSKFSVTSSSSSSDGYRLGESTSSGQTFRGNTSSSSPKLGSAEVYDEAPDLDDRRAVSSSSNFPSTVVKFPVSTASSQARRHGSGDKSAGVSDEFSHDPRYAKAFSPELEANEEEDDVSAESLFGQVGRDVLRLLRTSMQSLVLSIPHNAELVLDDTDIDRRVDPLTDERSCLRPNRQSSEERVPEADEDESYLHSQPSTRQGLSTMMPTNEDAPTLARYDSQSPIESQYESSNGDGRMTKKRKNPLGSISIGEEEEDEEREREDGSTREGIGAEGLTRYESAGGTRGKSRLGKVSVKKTILITSLVLTVFPALFDRTLVPTNPPTTAKAALAKLRHLPPRLSRDFWTLGRRRREIMGDQNHHPPLELPPVPIFTPPVVPRRSAPPPLKPGTGLKGSKAIKAAAKAEKERLKEQQRINALLGGSNFRLINLWDPLGLEESAAAIDRARRKALAKALQESGEKRAEVPTLEAFDVDGKTPPSIVKRYQVLNAAKDRLRVAELNAAKAREEENLRRLQKEKEELVREVEGSKAAAAAAAAAAAGADAVVDPLSTTPSAPPSASVPTAPLSPKATRLTRTRPSSPSATRSWSAQPLPPSAAPAAGKPSTATTVIPLSADRTNLPITSPTIYTTEPPSAIPPSTRKPRKKGKKKRSAHANALNPHHLNNYTPSRMPNRSSSGAAGSSLPHTDAPPSLLSILDDEVQPLSSWPASDQVISQALLTIRNRSAGEALRFFAGPEEDVCAFCDYELWFGGEGNLERLVRRRKKVLKFRKKAKERARKAANGKVAAATTTTTMEDQGGERVEAGSGAPEVVDTVE